MVKGKEGIDITVVEGNPSSVPFCPLLMMVSEKSNPDMWMDRRCSTRCAWYLTSYKQCAVTYFALMFQSKMKKG